MKILEDNGDVLADVANEAVIIVLDDKTSQMVMTPPDDASAPAPYHVQLAAGMLALLRTEEGQGHILEALMKHHVEVSNG